MPHLSALKAGMLVRPLFCFVGTDEGLQVPPRWRGFPESEDTLEPKEKLLDNVPQLLEELLCPKNAPLNLVKKARLQYQL